MSLLRGVLDFAALAGSDLGIMIKSIISKLLREFFAGEIQNYQSLVYPPQDFTFGSSDGMFTPVWVNHSNEVQTISDWDMDIFTSNATGTLFTLAEDTNNVNYYTNPLDLHGRHDLVVCQHRTNLINFKATYGMMLHGLADNGVIYPSDTVVDENGLAQQDNAIVWTWPFLVKPTCEVFNEDTTRQFSNKRIIVEKTGIVFLITRASSIFYLPDGFTSGPPSWTTSGFGVLNIMFFFCGKVQSNNIVTNSIHSNGSPTNTTNRDVVSDDSNEIVVVGG